MTPTPQFWDLYIDPHTEAHRYTHTFAYAHAHTTVTPQSLDPQPPWQRAARPDGLGDSWLEMMSLDCSDGRSHTGMLKDKGREAEDGKTEEEVDLYICSVGVVDGTGILRPILKALIVLKTGQVLNSMWLTDDTHLSNSRWAKQSTEPQGCAWSCTSPTCSMWLRDEPWWSMRSPALTRACVCTFMLSR